MVVLMNRDRGFRLFVELNIVCMLSLLTANANLRPVLITNTLSNLGPRWRRPIVRTMNCVPDLQALLLYLNSLKQTKSSLLLSRHFSLDSVLAQDLLNCFLWNCDFSPFSFLRVSSALHKVITVHIC